MLDINGKLDDFGTPTFKMFVVGTDTKNCIHKT